jgi:hypothetical protein
MRLRLPRLAPALLSALFAASLLSAAPAPPERAPASKVAYVYDRDKQAADAFKKLLDDEKLPTDLVPVADLSKADLKAYTLVLIGSDTEGGAAEAAKALEELKKPTLALGEGGYAYLGALRLAIGAPNGWHGTLTSLWACDAKKEKFWTTCKVKLPEDKALAVYKASGHVGIHLPSPPGDVALLGREANNATHYVLVKQGPRHVLWGFTAAPDQMTAEGKQLFVHTCRYTEALGAAKK